MLQITLKKSKFEKSVANNTGKSTLKSEKVLQITLLKTKLKKCIIIKIVAIVSEL